MEKYIIEVVINKEKLSDGSDVFVIHCPTLGVVSQGKNIDEARANIKEAIELYLEEQPEDYEKLENEGVPLFSIVEITKNAKTSSIIR